VTEHQFVRYLYEMLMSHFLIVWLFLLFLIIGAGVFLGMHSDPPSATVSEPGNSGGGLRPPGRMNLLDGASAVVLFVFVAFYVSTIFYKEDFAYYDDDMLTNFSVQGQNFPLPIWPSLGRFYPLADQEFNLLKYFTRSPTGFHSFVVVELLILLGVLFVVLDKFKIRYRALILISAMVAPSFIIPFTGFVYPERNVLFWLAIMVLCLQRYSTTKSWVYFIGCLVATHFALYYKEVVVLFIVAYAVTRILLQLSAKLRAGRLVWSEFVRENSLSLGMLAVASIFLVFFLSVLLPHRNFSYIAQHRESLSSVFLTYLQTDWLALIFLAAVIVRFGWVLYSGGQLDPMWDSLGVGALAYFFGVTALRVNSGYYLAPVNLFALLYLASMLLVWLSKPTKARVFVVAIVFICVFLHDVAYSSFRMIERKNLITTKSEFANFLKGHLPTADNSIVELYFPYANGFHLMGLSDYLRYKGFQLVGQTGTKTDAGPRLLIEGRERFTNNRCVDYRDYACMHEDTPGANALIVVLPDDLVSMNDVKNIGNDSTPLLSLKAPEISTKKWFRSFHAISPEFSVGQLPEHWLQLDVFKNTTSPSISSFPQPIVPRASGQDLPAL
jgi:hypothetical protein